MTRSLVRALAAAFVTVTLGGHHRIGLRGLEPLTMEAKCLVSCEKTPV